MRTLLLGLCLAVAACGSSLKVSSTEKSSAELAHYRTYAHETAMNAPEGFQQSSLTPEVLGKVMANVDAEMTKKGYTNRNDGQLIVRIAGGRRKVEKQPTGAAAVAGADPIPETEGEIVIDMFDRATGAQVFHGVAHDIVQPGKVPSDDKLSEAVDKVLAPVPNSAPSP